MADQGASRNDSLCDDDLEAQMYAMVHYSTDSIPDVTIPVFTSTNSTTEENTSVDIDKDNNASRYWKKEVPSTQKKDSVYSKVNVRKDDKDRFKEEDLNISKNNTKDTPNVTPTNTENKFLITEKNQIDPVFQSPIMENAIITIELMKNDNKHVVTLESSDDDDVIEVELPPKPTIYIESSDDEELLSIQAVPSPVDKSLNINLSIADDKISKKSVNEKSKSKLTESCSSPVPSVVSSVSDDFIRGDCVALNISSHSQENYNFNFNLHGADLVDDTQNNSLTSKSKKKKNKQKQKEKLNSSSINCDKSVPDHNTSALSTSQLVSSTSKECFITPKSKVASKKRDKSKASILDSLVKGPEKLLNVPENEPIIKKQVHEQTSSLESSLNVQCSREDNGLDNSTVIDKADVSFSDTDIVIANVVDQAKSKTSSENNRNDLIEEFKNKRKTYNPPVLNLAIDFEFHPFGYKETNRRNNEPRVYSIESCMNDMDKFYNMSWGGEDFDHIKTLKSMPRDKGLWHIDPSDRVHHNKRRTACHTCNKFGHRDDRCPWKKPKCFMCGLVGHWETRCPYKICLNCGSKNHLYTSTCRNCSNWGNIFCNTCSNYGHPTTRCPDQWRRYHLTVDNINELIFSRTSQEKPRGNLHCSGCSQRGHILNHCRNFMPFNSYCPATPFIANYTGNPIYLQVQLKNIPSLPHDQNITTPRMEKRKWEVSTTSTSASNLKHQVNVVPSSTKYQNLNTPLKKNDDNSRLKAENSKSKSENSLEIGGIGLSNPKKTYVLQDNEVSNTDNAITTAKMLLTKDYSTKLSTSIGLEFLKSEATKHNIEYNIEISSNGNELNIKGTGENQVRFQTAVREWLEVPILALGEADITFDNIPKKGAQIVVKLKKALQYLKLDIGDPKELHKEYKHLEKIRRKILKEKNVGQKKLKNIRNKLNAVVKNLNMILLGQAGLADGSMHLNELYTLRDILQRSNGKVSPDMRAKVAKHYNAIFSPVHRTDYDLLISKYYESRHEKSKRLQIYSSNTAAVAHTPNIINSKPTAVALVPKLNSGECEQRLHVLLSRLSRCCVALQGAVLKSSDSVQRRNNFINQLKKFEYPAIRYGMTPAKKRQLTGLLMEIDNALPLLK